MIVDDGSGYISGETTAPLAWQLPLKRVRLQVMADLTSETSAIRSCFYITEDLRVSPPRPDHDLKEIST